VYEQVLAKQKSDRVALGTLRLAIERVIAELQRRATTIAQMSK